MVYFLDVGGIKMSDSTNAGGGGIGFLGLLTIVFIVLKLTDVISWSWLWVLAPIWIPTCLGILAVILFMALKPNKN